MHSIKSAVDEATLRLASTAARTPRLDAEVLMAFILAWPRSRLYAHWDELVAGSDRHRYRQLVDRRAAGEPIAYIRRMKEFFGIELYVDERVLIPRPETELLVARALAWLRQRAVPPPPAERPGEGPARRPSPSVVDVGTGSGAIAIALLMARIDMRLFATDISAEALDVARLNAAAHHVAPEFLQGSLLEPLTEPVDLIVANLPYISAADMEHLHGTSIDFEPRVALTDEADGLRLFAQLLAQAPAKLKPGGCILLEIGSEQPAALQALARDCLPSFRASIFLDYAGLPRVLQLEQFPSAAERG